MIILMMIIIIICAHHWNSEDLCSRITSPTALPLSFFGRPADSPCVFLQAFQMNIEMLLV
jgi:hypothetical protein